MLHVPTRLATILARANLDMKEMHTPPLDAQISTSAPTPLSAETMLCVPTQTEDTPALVPLVTPGLLV